MDSSTSRFIVPDWSQAQWSGAWRRVPALILNLSSGLAFHEPAAGMVAAGASLSVGLVGTRQVAGSSLKAMMMTAGVMALSAGVGTMVGASFWLNPLVTALWGLAFAFFTIHDEDLGWIAMQGVIVFVIATAFPSQGYAALARLSAVLFGGAMQIGSVTLLDLVFRQPETNSFPPNFRWNEFVGSFRSFSAAWRYAVRVALTMIVAVEAARFLSIQNGYWLPMTTIIVLKPDFYRTYSGAVQRVLGTFLGVIVASVIAHFCHPSTGWLIGFVALFSFACFLLIKVSPTLFSAALTAYVVFLIATTGLPETSITGHRLIDTALGSALALGSRLLGYRSIRGFFKTEKPGQTIASG